MAYFVTNEDIQLLKQNVKTIYIKIELLNQHKQIIDIMHGELIEENIAIDASSPIRRVGTFTFLLKNKGYLTSEISKIWFNKLVRVKYGFLNLNTNKICWYGMGLFAFTQNQFVFDEVTRIVTCTCKDLMVFLTGEINGYLGGVLETNISMGSEIRSVIISTLKQFSFITKYIVEDVGGKSSIENYNTVPYDLKFPVDVTGYDIISKLCDLYAGWEFFFDLEGTFVCRKIPVNCNDISVLKENIFSPLVKSENVSIDMTKVKNVSEVFGMDNIHSVWKEVSKEPTEEEKQADKKKYNCEHIGYTINPDSPFCCDKIGEFRNKPFADGEYAKISTQELCDQRAEYENWLTTRMEDVISLEITCIPFLDVNNKISYTSYITEKTNEYLVKKINTSFLTGVMNVEIIKFYPLYPYNI